MAKLIVAFRNSVTAPKKDMDEKVIRKTTGRRKKKGEERKNNLITLFDIQVLRKV